MAQSVIEICSLRNTHLRGVPEGDGIRVKVGSVTKFFALIVAVDPEEMNIFSSSDFQPYGHEVRFRGFHDTDLHEGRVVLGISDGGGVFAIDGHGRMYKFDCKLDLNAKKKVGKKDVPVFTRLYPATTSTHSETSH